MGREVLQCKGITGYAYADKLYEEQCKSVRGKMILSP